MSEWLAAYEAQKAKALKKIEEGGGGAASSGNARGALGGSTSYQGLVDAKDVRHLSRSTQITKIMDNMKSKKPDDEAATEKPKATPDKKSSAISQLLSVKPAGNQHHSSPVHQDSSGQLQRQGSLPNYPKSSEPAAMDKESVRSPPPLHNQPPNPLSNRQAKKRAQHSEPSVNDLMRKVKRDATRSSGDWKTLYEDRKKQALEKMEKVSEGGKDMNVGSLSTFHTPSVSDQKDTKGQDHVFNKSPVGISSGRPAYPKPSSSAASEGSTNGLLNYPKPSVPASTISRASTTLQTPAMDKESVRSPPSLHNLPPNPLSNRQAKKAAEKAEPSVNDLMRKVKRDASRSSGDWKTLYEERKKQALDNMERVNEGSGEMKVGSLSAFHTPPEPSKDSNYSQTPPPASLHSAGKSFGSNFTRPSYPKPPTTYPQPSAYSPSSQGGRSTAAQSYMSATNSPTGSSGRFGGNNYGASQRGPPYQGNSHSSRNGEPNRKTFDSEPRRVGGGPPLPPHLLLKQNSNSK